MAPALLFLGAWALRVIVLAAAPGDDPARATLSASFAIRAAALGSLAVGLVWALARASRGAVAVRRLAHTPGGDGGAGSLEGALVRATGDSSLRVAFPLNGGRWIDADGRPVEPPRSRADRAVTAILREGEPVAAVLHHPAILDGRVLEREIGTAAQLAIDNERLRAEARVQLAELKASRARIVETGDLERRRLERDLHDGAQQRLVSLAVALRMARTNLDAERDPDGAAALREADEGLHRAITELRELAHGIHPVELSEEGLAAALDALADRSPLPLQIGALPAERLTQPVETAAYVLVDEVVHRAARRRDRATLTVSGRHAAGRLVLQIEDPVEPSPVRALAGLVAVADRIAALDGRLEAAPAASGGVVITADVACV